MTTSHYSDIEQNEAEARSAFDEIVSDIVARPLKEVQDDIQNLAAELRNADEEAMNELKRLRRALGTPENGAAGTLFGLLGDPETIDGGTLASQLERIQQDIHSAEELLAAHQEDLKATQSRSFNQLTTRQQQDSAQATLALATATESIDRLSTSTTSLTSAVQAQSDQAQRNVSAVNTRLNVLTILVVLQMVALTALTLMR